MKTSTLIATSLALVWPFLLACSGFAQGDLNPPPGPPAPTMKTLDQLEPRTIINAANTPGDATATFIISAPGSYYLAGNLTGETGMNGIRITADNVTLDLHGFALIGVAGTKAGIITETVRNFAVRNGSVQSWAGMGSMPRNARTPRSMTSASPITERMGLAPGMASPWGSAVW